MTQPKRPVYRLEELRRSGSSSASGNERIPSLHHTCHLWSFFCYWFHCNFIAGFWAAYKFNEFSSSSPTTSIWLPCHCSPKSDQASWQAFDYPSRAFPLNFQLSLCQRKIHKASAKFLPPHLIHTHTHTRQNIVRISRMQNYSSQPGIVTANTVLYSQPVLFLTPWKLAKAGSMVGNFSSSFIGQSWRIVCLKNKDSSQTWIRKQLNELLHREKSKQPFKTRIYFWLGQIHVVLTMMQN